MDWSKDGTRDFLDDLRKNSSDNIYLHVRNMGNGMALMDRADLGLRRYHHSETDLEYDPADYTELINLLSKAQPTARQRW